MKNGKVIKKISYLLLGSLFLIVIVFWSTIKYGIAQAKGQYEVISNARPINEFLDDPNFPDSLKTKIELVQVIRKYAIDSLGLNDTENYTTLYDQKGENILWNLSACEPFEMKPKLWSFPFLGSFPYKGFFDLEKAKAERDELDEQGYDTRIRTVGGWSTLGWFKDPILSNMLGRNEGSLADLIIHELTHSTLFVKDSVEFNENLASFIGKKGAEIFLIDYFGPDSKEYAEYMESYKYSQSFRSHMLTGYKSLDSLFQSFDNKELTDDEKRSLKADLIGTIIDRLDTITSSHPERLKSFFSKQLPNNAYFMAFQRYGAKQGLFMDEYLNKFDEDIRSFITHYKSLYPSL